MVLEFKFNYKSSNKTLMKFLDFVAKKFNCDYKIYQKLDFVYLYIEAEDEILEEFSNTLSLYVPMSIFYYGLELEVVEKLPLETSSSFDEESIISFSPSSLKEVEDKDSIDFYNAFKSCEVSKGFEDATFIFENQEVKSDKKLFEKLSFLINEDKKIKIKTLSGTFVFSKLKNIEKSKELLVVNLENISSLVVEDANSIVALASIEKPKIEFRINDIFRLKNKTDKKSIDIRYVNDLTLYLLSLELKKLDIDFLNIENEDASFDYFLDVKSKNIINLDIPKILCFDNKKLILESNSYSKKLDTVFSKFKEKDKSQFMTVLAENELFENSIISFYISSSNKNKISYYSKNGLVDILQDLYIPSTIEEVFESIKKDTKGERLLKNYKNKFEDIYNKALNTEIDFSDKTFLSYFKIAKIILNFEDDIILNATNSLLEKGPRIDYKLFDNKEVFNRKFDYLPLLKSAMSFKLAGVDEQTISLGFIESLAHFIANEVDNLHGNYELEGVSLSGDMFSNIRFNQLVEKSITKNFKIYYNKEFVIQK
ncbi:MULTISPECIES: hypothetical protein [Arcobacteraceae]|uniref:Protein hydE n=3 Tax=Aliarcobacter thereius TaxID=544718 RepID=A0A5R9HB61_9BACT|nr:MULTISPECIES: hypothetical protein [Arcobacteraceae]OCL83089.1 hypothetical protein AAW30_01163 [Arcobacter porcinus]OCL83419.1 hypothetical protein AAW29_01013 [Arcobacter porcinus]OCL93746.1 hypothetical protein AAX25_00065 [Aliarcobacter thereius]OCL95154.1 hypothetical protein AA347_00605 [Aliarcobacter thereius LMG 24486]QBF16856.1 hypothetical protein ATH_1839 [Aliarcobacter thereius LMG 24486]